MKYESKELSYDQKVHQAFKIYKACVFNARLLNDKQKLMLKIEFGINEV